MAIKEYHAANIRKWLKIILVLFIVSTGLTVWANGAKTMNKTVLIEAGVGIVITLLFIWYTWSLASACDEVSIDNPEAVKRAMEEFKQSG
jgi:uncharacterized membrane protein YkvI